MSGSVLSKQITSYLIARPTSLPHFLHFIMISPSGGFSIGITSIYLHLDILASHNLVEQTGHLIGFLFMPLVKIHINPPNVRTLANIKYVILVTF